jgi:hypothetical protein
MHCKYRFGESSPVLRRHPHENRSQAMQLAPGPDGFTIDATDLGGLFGLPAAGVRELMRSGAITTSFERGEGDDAGRFRLTFRHGRKHVQLIVDAEGRVLQRTSVNHSAPPTSAPRRPE